jgi:hypothetical protein
MPGRVHGGQKSNRKCQSLERYEKTYFQSHHNKQYLPFSITMSSYAIFLVSPCIQLFAIRAISTSPRNAGEDINLDVKDHLHVLNSSLQLYDGFHTQSWIP